MDNTELQNLITLGENTLISKYFTLAATVVALWDYLLTLSDEVKYVWKRDKSWAFWLFITSRYSILLFKTWSTISSQWPGYTQKLCNRTVKLEGYYFVFIVTVGQIFLTMRVYALTEASKYVLVFFGILATSSLGTGLWLVSIPSAKAVQMPEIDFDPFRACTFIASEVGEWAYRSQVAFTDLITFICIVAFAFRIKAKHGQLRMTRLLRTILQDSFLYFFVMAAFHVGIAFFTFFITPSARVFPPIAITVLIPILISRLVISLRKAAEVSLVQAWDGDHFTTVEGSEHEMMSFARPSLPPPTFSSPIFKRPFSNLDPKETSSSHATSCLSAA